METGYKIENILLLECQFKRLPDVTFDNTNVTTNVEINVNCKVENDTVFVIENVIFESKFNDIVEVHVGISMLGVFEKVGDAPLKPEDFGNVNGAAILYPYIREQLSNITLKAGLGNIVLPPVNFVKMAENKKA